MPAHIVRLFLPLTLVMLLTVFVGLPDTESHAQTAEDAAAAEANEEAPEAEGAATEAGGEATEATPEGNVAAIGSPAGDVTEAADAEAATEAEGDGEAHDEDKKDIPWDQTTAPTEAAAFIEMIGNGRFAEAYDAGSPLMRSSRTAEALKSDMTEEGLLSVQSVEWDNGVATQGGLRLDGTAKLADGSTLPIYAIVLEEGTSYKVLDVQSSESFVTRMTSGTANGLDWLVGTFLLSLIGALFFIIYRYVSGLKGSPRELYLLFFTKVTEYSAYGAANMAFVLYLHNDVGLSDIGAGTYIGAWSMGLTALTMVVGAVCDAIGVKRTLLIGCYALLISRIFMPLLSDIYLTSIFGFLPLAVGIAITGPVLSVGIKLFTNRAGATLGFGLFYTLMNVGWAIGAWIFDEIRGMFGDGGATMIAGMEFSTYQVIILVGFFLTIPDIIAITFIRRGVEMTENGIKITPIVKQDTSEPLFTRISSLVKTSSKDTWDIFKSVFPQRSFHIYLAMLGLLVFVKLTFYHFHYTFPTYGIRVFGEGVKIGSMFGVLNPLMIVFLVPLIAAMTMKVRSYWMLLIGTFISSGSVFLATIDPSNFAFLCDTWFGELIFDRWLEIPVGRRDPFYMSLVVFFIFFTIGEAIWSPRLMQFTAEIAPPGREGTYVALSYLPYFAAKFIAAPMSGWLIATYTPDTTEQLTDHYMVWVWIGCTAIITPLGMLFFKNIYKKAEDDAAAAAEAVAAEASAAAAEDNDA
jgi:dipeptide/tripeptide permease